MPCVKKCCCCVNLRVGGIMMGIFTLSLSLLSIIPTSISLVNRVFLSRVITHLVSEYNNKESNGEKGPQDFQDFWGKVQSTFSTDGSNLPPSDNEDVVWLSSIMLIFFIVLLVFLGIYFICSVLLIVGTYKGKRWLMLPWIIITFLVILAYVGGMLISTWYFGFSIEAIFLFACSLIETAIALYLWICVISLFQVLENSNLANQNWELKPRFTTNYDGVPTEEP